jgi:thiamine biosynthesis protein ThiI
MKLVSLLSSGIDSPVATYLLSKKAKEIIVVHGDIQPFTDKKEHENFLKLLKHLKKIIKSDIKSYVLFHGNSLNEYIKNCDKKFTCIFCKRMLLRYAEKISEMYNFDAVIMGDSLGQVASQTLQNINVIDQAVKIPVFRPLIGFDKQEIVSIAKKISTYDLSILPSGGCNAVPNKPSTAAKLEKILLEEKKIDIKKLVEDTIKHSKIIEI